MQFFNQWFQLLIGFVQGFFLVLVLQFAQIDRAFGHAAQRRAIKFGEVVQCPLINAVGHQQYFNAFFAEYFQLRAVFRSGKVLGSQVVDGLLPFFHIGFVLRQ